MPTCPNVGTQGTFAGMHGSFGDNRSLCAQRGLEIRSKKAVKKACKISRTEMGLSALVKYTLQVQNGRGLYCSWPVKQPRVCEPARGDGALSNSLRHGALLPVARQRAGGGQGKRTRQEGAQRQRRRRRRRGVEKSARRAAFAETAAAANGSTLWFCTSTRAQAQPRARRTVIDDHHHHHI